MSDGETRTAGPRIVARESKIAAELEAQMARIRQQLDDVTAGTIATITAPPTEPVAVAELPPPPAEAVAAEPVAETTSAVPVETRRKFEAYGKSIASALSGFPIRIGGGRKLVS